MDASLGPPLLTFDNIQNDPQIIHHLSSLDHATALAIYKQVIREGHFRVQPLLDALDRLQEFSPAVEALELWLASQPQQFRDQVYEDAEAAESINALKRASKYIKSIKSEKEMYNALQRIRALESWEHFPSGVPISWYQASRKVDEDTPAFERLSMDAWRNMTKIASLAPMEEFLRVTEAYFKNHPKAKLTGGKVVEILELIKVHATRSVTSLGSELPPPAPPSVPSSTHRLLIPPTHGSLSSSSLPRSAASLPPGDPLAPATADTFSTQGLSYSASAAPLESSNIHTDDATSTAPSEPSSPHASDSGDSTRRGQKRHSEDAGRDEDVPQDSIEDMDDEGSSPDDRPISSRVKRRRRVTFSPGNSSSRRIRASHSGFGHSTLPDASGLTLSPRLTGRSQSLGSSMELESETPDSTSGTTDSETPDFDYDESESGSTDIEFDETENGDTGLDITEHDIDSEFVLHPTLGLDLQDPTPLQRRATPVPETPNLTPTGAPATPPPSSPVLVTPLSEVANPFSTIPNTTRPFFYTPSSSPRSDSTSSYAPSPPEQQARVNNEDERFWEPIHDALFSRHPNLHPLRREILDLQNTIRDTATSQAQMEMEGVLVAPTTPISAQTAQEESLRNLRQRLLELITVEPITIEPATFLTMVAEAEESIASRRTNKRRTKITILLYTTVVSILLLTSNSYSILYGFDKGCTLTSLSSNDCWHHGRRKLAEGLAADICGLLGLADSGVSKAVCEVVLRYWGSAVCAKLADAVVLSPKVTLSNMVAWARARWTELELLI